MSRFIRYTLVIVCITLAASPCCHRPPTARELLAKRSFTVYYYQGDLAGRHYRSLYVLPEGLLVRSDRDGSRTQARFVGEISPEAVRSLIGFSVDAGVLSWKEWYGPGTAAADIRCERVGCYKGDVQRSVTVVSPAKGPPGWARLTNKLKALMGRRAQ